MALAWIIKILLTGIFIVIAMDAFRPPRKISSCLLVVGVGVCMCAAIWLLEIKTATEKAILLGVIGILAASHVASIVEERKERIQAKIPS